MSKKDDVGSFPTSVRRRRNQGRRMELHKFQGFLAEMEELGTECTEDLLFIS